MSYQATVYNVMIASPSDVTAERAIIREVIYEWDNIYSNVRNIVLLPIGWESHSSPEMGDTAQNIINKQVLDKSDILIGVFWTRLGTPTTDYQSGSVEEIEKHIETGNLTMLYFSSIPVAMDSVDQNQYFELVQFRESCKARGIFESYDSLNDFKEKLYRHLQMKLNEHEMFKNNNPDTSGEFIKANSNLPSISDDAKALLKEMSLDAHGQVFCLRTLSGTNIVANRKDFCAAQTPREIAKWKGIIRSLLEKGLIIRTGSGKDEIYVITDSGYTVADSI